MQQPRGRRRRSGLLMPSLVLLLALAPPAAAFVARPSPRREQARPPLLTSALWLRASTTTTTTTTPSPTTGGGSAGDGGSSSSSPLSPPVAAGEAAASASSLRVRRATRADLRRVATMQVMEYGGKGLAFAWHYLQELDRLQTSFWVEPDRHAMLVIEDDASTAAVTMPIGPLGAWLLGDPTVVGFVDLDARDRRVDRSTPDPYLSDLIIDPARRGQGLGRLLMAEAEAVAGGMWGFPAVYLKVRATNARGLALYGMLGYEVVGEGETTGSGEGGGVYTMRKWVVGEGGELPPEARAAREAEEKELLVAAAALMNPFVFDPAWGTGPLDGEEAVGVGGPASQEEGMAEEEEEERGEWE